MGRETPSMRAPFIFLCAFALVAHAPRANAETWTTQSAQTFEGKLSGVYGSIAVVASPKGGTTLVSVDQLDDPSLVKVADALDKAGKEPPTWAASTGKVAKSLRHRLQILKEGKLVDFDPGTRPEPELYLVYFGAHWCRPCREFSPHLVQEYQRLRELAADRFELVFVSSDHNRDDQALYAREVGMPWPILKFSEVGSADAIERWDGPAIPDLVVVTRNGDLVYDSFSGSTYLGPQAVIEQVEPLLGAMNENSASCRRALHRLSVLRYVRASAATTKPPAPYLLSLDPSRYQTLETKHLTAILSIDEHGCVRDVKIEPKIPVVLEFQLEEETGRWLFFPAVVNGQPKPTRVRLPINF
jgi:thiol-disulfide isomerase/thioredoxin